MNNQAAIRAIYPQIDWDTYDREVSRLAVKRIRSAIDTKVLGMGWDRFARTSTPLRAILDEEAAR